MSKGRHQSLNKVKNEHTTENTFGITDFLDENCENPLISTEHSYDQALELAGNGKFQIFVLFVIGLSGMSVPLDGVCMSYVLPTAKCELKMSTAEQGFINSVTFLGSICGTHLWGFLADTWGRRKVMLVALLLNFVMSLVSSLSVSSWMLIITRFACGFGSAGVSGTVITYFGELMTNKNRSRYLAFVISFMILGLFLQPLLGMVVLTRSFEWSFFHGLFVYKPWRLFIFINSLIAGIGFLGMILLPESPKFLLAMDKPKEALDIIRKMYAFNSGKPKDMFPVQNIASLDVTGTNLSDVAGIKDALYLVWNQTIPLFRSPHLINLLMICISAFAINFVIHGQELWYPQILSYYSKNIEMPITICEAVSLGHTAELSANVNTTNLINSTTPADLEICNVIIDPIIFNVTVTMRFCIWIFNVLTGFIINRFGAKSTLGVLMLGDILEGLHRFPSRLYDNFTFLASSFGLVTLSVLAIRWTNQFHVNNILMTIIASMNICELLLIGRFGGLFPTHLRTMAVNIILMFGRFGSMLGVNFVAAMIFRFCDTLYGINFFIMLGAMGAIYFMLWK